jgi:cytochrome P450
MLSDPNAIRHTIHTMGYGYPKTRESKTFTGLAFGRGVSWAGGQYFRTNLVHQFRLYDIGETHVRHRKLLNPAFTAQAQRPFYPVFRRVAAQVLIQRD